MGCVGGSGSITLVFISYIVLFWITAIGKNKKNRKKDVGWLVNVAAVTEDNKGQARGHRGGDGGELGGIKLRRVVLYLICI